MGRAARSPSTCLKTPQDYSKEGRLKPFFANNVDIPFARARRLKPCPAESNGPQRKTTNAYVRFYVINKNVYEKTPNDFLQFFNLGVVQFNGGFPSKHIHMHLDFLFVRIDIFNCSGEFGKRPIQIGRA